MKNCSVEVNNNAEPLKRERIRKARKLFIINSNNLLGGANQSLKNLISNLNEKVDMIAPKDANVSNQTIKNYFGSNINKIYRYFLPFRISFEGGGNSLRKGWIETEVAYRKNKKEIMDMILANRYDYVHLNSYVLYPLITKGYPVYIHVREICKVNPFIKPIIQAKIRKVKGIIYIDEATKKALGVEKNSVVINNPFNQKSVLNVDVESIRIKYLIKETDTVYTFISASGSLAKGISFIIDAFVDADCQNAKLLMVGVKKMPEYERCSNVIFLGNVLQMDEIYAVSDYVLRGERQFCIGRTIYEGLYSGCNVIIPGSLKKDSKKMFEYEKFKNEIFFYKTRNKESLISVLRERTGKKKKMLLGLSNVEEYVKRFNKFTSEE